MIPNFFEPSDKPRRTVRNVFRLKDNFFKVEEFVIGFDSSGKAWQNLLLGIGESDSPVMDSKLERHITYLFCGKNCDFTNGLGQDLAARNIQRGRDEDQGIQKIQVWSIKLVAQSFKCHSCF